ncbi:alpha/beta fold hydrolase [Streptomyces sp. MUM 203J]|uniref:alpha/beta hydrolase family protein n=1 Tax=Streptomyces sp. MUM 203J TaxID=2791990 RepID=UPI001F038B97|nr:alpha/beta fold hydrolase [Streptomyces sp. MUM 203J]MCH0538265.1 alpha/beta fold hydrolase [Streptomyces sp. MUM 203J]
MTSFLETPGVLGPFVDGNRSRAFGGGLDPFVYERVTGGLDSLYRWPSALREVAEGLVGAAEGYAAGGHRLSAGEALRTAARWFHFATLLPHPDRELLGRTAAEADDTMRRALGYLDPGAARVEGDTFAGWLRRPERGAAEGRLPLAVVIPGLDSSKEEFHGVVDALLARGAAVCAIDGPGQGVRAATSRKRADYQVVVAELLDSLEDAHPDLETRSAGLVGMSLGGYYATVSAAHDPRVRAAVAVSGPYFLTWDELPLFVTDTLTLRCGSAGAAREFARGVDLRDVAGGLRCPLLVVEGGTDVVPGVANGVGLSAAVPDGTLLTVPHGDHLVGNARADWLPATADWVVDHLTSARG